MSGSFVLQFLSDRSEQESKVVKQEAENARINGTKQEKLVEYVLCPSIVTKGKSI